MGYRERLATSIVDLRERGKRLARLHLELFSSELKEKGQKVGVAVGLFIGAGVLALYAVGLALATIAVALALILPLWLSLLIETAVLGLIIAVMILVGRGKLEELKRSAPETALSEAKVTADLITENVRGAARDVRGMASRRGARAASRRGSVATSTDAEER